MSDDELRRLERAFRETGAIDDETALIKARLRQGLPPERVELAAWLGQPAARQVAGPDARDFHASPSFIPAVGPLADVELPIGWIKNATGLDPQLCVRVAIAALTRLCPEWRPPAELDWPHDRGPIEIAEDVLIRPCDRHADLARDAGDRLTDHADAAESKRHRALAFLLSLAADGGDDGAPGEWGDSPEERLLAAMIGDGSPAAFATEEVLSTVMVDGAEQGLTIEAVQEAIRAELVPWLLGHADPVRERVESRD